MITESREALAALARAISRRFDLEFVAVAVPREGDWDIYEVGARTIELDKRQLTNAYAAAHATLEFDAYARTYAGHRTTTVAGTAVRLVPLRLGTTPIGVLAAAGRPVEVGTLDTLAGVGAARRIRVALRRTSVENTVEAGVLRAGTLTIGFIYSRRSAPGDAQRCRRACDGSPRP